MKYITKPVGVLAIMYGILITYNFLIANMHLTEMEMWFYHWQEGLKIICIFIFGIVLYNVDD